MILSIIPILSILTEEQCKAGSYGCQAALLCLFSGRLRSPRMKRTFARLCVLLAGAMQAIVGVFRAEHTFT
jgi:hypothetical protein